MGGPVLLGILPNEGVIARVDLERNVGFALAGGVVEGDAYSQARLAPLGVAAVLVEQSELAAGRQLYGYSLHLRRRRHMFFDDLEGLPRRERRFLELALDRL